MPGAVTKKKDLYIGKCLDDIHKLSEVKQLGNSVNIIVRSADKVFRDAKKLDEEGDEEKALVLYMKYFNILKQVKIKADYKKQKEYFDNIIGRKNQIQAIERAEVLTESLKDRYDFKKAEVLANKLSPVDAPPKVRDEPPKVSKVAGDNIERKPRPEVVAVPEKESSLSSISCMQLCDLLRDSATKLILIDVRTGSDYSQSHISHSECINIPEENISPGSTVNHIAAKLSQESKVIWDTRKNADHIILIDWRSKMEDVKVGTPIHTLKDALYKFDTNVMIQSQPLVLDGGYEKWLVFYPTMTTNAHVAVPNQGNKKNRTPSPTLMLDFDYPELDENLQIQKKTEPQPVQNNNAVLTPNGNIPLNPLVPTIDRSLKPSIPKPAVANSPLQPLKNDQPIGETNIDSSKPSNINMYPSLIADSKGVNGKSQFNANKDSAVIINTSGPKQINLSFKNNLASEASAQKQDTNSVDVNKRNLQEEKDKVEEVERKLKELDLLKKKKERDVADLMRKERKIKEEGEADRLRREENERLLIAEEQKRRASELQAQKDQEDKMNRLMDVERMRAERKKQEEEMLKEKENEEDELRRIKAEKEALRLKEEQDKREIELHRIEELKKIEREEEEKIALEMQQLEKAKAEKAENLRKELQRQEEAKKFEEERKRNLEEARQKEIKDKEMEAARKEEERKNELAKMQAIEEARKAKEKEENIRLAEIKNKEKSAHDQRNEKVVPTTNLPTGWEKRLDKDTNRYYYIDHNKGITTWSAPMISAMSKDTFTTKLKDEPRKVPTLSRGMSRSHSSPNIMKELEEEERMATKPVVQIDRATKPQPIITSNRIKQPMHSMRKRDLTPTYGNVIQGLTGLRNLGNTCYMNSTIQCLSNTSPLIEYFVSDNYHRDINRDSSQGMHGEVVDDFSIVIKALWSGQYRSITPRDLKSVIGKYNPMFAGYQQQDSQEFLTFLLDGLHEGLNEVRKAPDIPEQNNDNLSDSNAASLAWKHHKLLHRSIIVELFQGQLKSTLMCRTCRKTSVTFQAFMFLSLPIPASSRCSLRDCIQEFLKPEMMTGSCKWKCPNCKMERDSEKKIDIWKLPPILLVGLNRFYSDGMWMQKKTTYVDFPIMDVDFSPYTLGPPPRNSYSLYGISNHYGTMEGGHYTAFCRNAVTTKWHKFDDQDVNEISKSDIKTSAAFVLYYTSIEMPAPRYRIGT